MVTTIERGEGELHPSAETSRGLVVCAEARQKGQRLNGSSIAERLCEGDRHRAVVGVTPGRRLLRTTTELVLEGARGRALERVSESVAYDRSDENAA